jgi:uncharacterized protein (TIGR02266 family)
VAASEDDRLLKIEPVRKVSRSKLLKAAIKVRTQEGEREDEFSDYFLEVDKDRIYLKTDSPYPVGTRVHLQFDLPGADRTVHFRGEVVRINPHRPATPDGLAPGMGIVFERVSFDDRKTINDYLEKIQSEDHSEDYSMFLSWVSKISRPMSPKEREQIKKDLLKVIYTAKGNEPVTTAKRRKSPKEMDLISRVPLFQELDTIEIEEMVRILVREEFHPGDPLFQEGDVGDKMYIIIRGAVDIVKAAGKGPGQILVTLKPGDFLGEMSLIDDAPRSASAVAAEESVIFSINKKDLALLFDQAPIIAAKIYKFFVTTLNQRLRETNEKIKSFISMAQDMSRS